MKNTNIEDKDNMHLGGTERGTEDKYHPQGFFDVTTCLITRFCTTSNSMTKTLAFYFILSFSVCVVMLL